MLGAASERREAIDGAVSGGKQAVGLWQGLQIGGPTLGPTALELLCVVYKGDVS